MLTLASALFATPSPAAPAQPPASTPASADAPRFDQALQRAQQAPSRDTASPGGRDSVHEAAPPAGPRDAAPAAESADAATTDRQAPASTAMAETSDAPADEQGSARDALTDIADRAGARNWRGTSPAATRAATGHRGSADTRARDAGAADSADRDTTGVDAASAGPEGRSRTRAATDEATASTDTGLAIPTPPPTPLQPPESAQATPDASTASAPAPIADTTAPAAAAAVAIATTATTLPTSGARSEQLADDAPLPTDRPGPGPVGVAGARGLSRATEAAGAAPGTAELQRASMGSEAERPSRGAAEPGAREAGITGSPAAVDSGTGLRSLQSAAAWMAAPSGGSVTSPSGVGSGTAPSPADAASAAARGTDLDAPVGSPGFAPALGARIAMLARDGIDQARLHVSPAELGPIAVQLALDGTQLRVDMVADAAATRQALEQSLPALASSLRDAGFTLAGGGVFSPWTGSDGSSSGQGRDGSGSSEGSGRQGFGAAGPDGGERVAPAPSVRRARDQALVDLYA